MGIDEFRYDGKRALVIGGATGMGAATARTVAELGAEVVVMDVAEVSFPVDQTIKVDLRDRTSVDRALGEVAGPLDAVFACAGVADGTPGIMVINFIAPRYVIDRLRQDQLLGRGAAIAMISSLAGLGWERGLSTLLDFLAQPDWDAATEWISEHDGTDNYGFSKQAINAYVAHEAFPMLRDGIRINAILPGPTDTPLARANADIWLAFGADYRDACGIDTLAPEQIANVLAFLCSAAASGISGVTIVVDAGHVGSGLTGSFEAPIIKRLLGARLRSGRDL